MNKRRFGVISTFKLPLSIISCRAIFSSFVILASTISDKHTLFPMHVSELGSKLSQHTLIGAKISAVISIFTSYSVFSSPTKLSVVVACPLEFVIDVCESNVIPSKDSDTLLN